MFSLITIIWYQKLTTIIRIKFASALGMFLGGWKSL
uniref:Uncharacterized protein n=1 Tax=Rhizophora mucronata TaxID=61149 RepID=A0A2P2R052_RHIMU